MGYRARSKFSAFPRPPDPPGQSSEALSRLVNEARKLCDEMIPTVNEPSIWQTGTLRNPSFLTTSEMRKQMGLPDPYRMESAIPPATREQELATDMLYHPSSYTMMTGSVPWPIDEARMKIKSVTLPVPPRPVTKRPPLPPMMDEYGRELKRLEDRARVRHDKWREWKILWHRLRSWWERDFGQRPTPVLPQPGQVLPGGCTPLQSGQTSSPSGASSMNALSSSAMSSSPIIKPS